MCMCVSGYVRAGEMTPLPRLLAALFQNSFQLGNCLEIFRSPRRALYLNEALETQATALDVEWVQEDGVRQ